VRVLTGGAVRSAPLIFDLLVGRVPPQDSPLLGFLFMATQMTWFRICDGGALTAAFLREHPAAALPPPPGCAFGPAAPAEAAGQPRRLGLRASIAAAAAAAAAEAEEAAAVAVAEARRAPAAPVAPAALQPLRAAAAPAAEGSPAASGRATPADSGRSEGTAWGGPGRLQSMPSMRSSDSSSSLGSTASGKFDPLGLAAPVARAKAKAGRSA
jgi:hypothetical protein